MLSRIKPRLTYANVVSSIALFSVLGGGAYATIDRKIGSQDIRKNAVKQKQLAPGGVKAAQLARNSVRPQKVATNAIRPRHILDGAVTEDKLADGVAVSGPQGPPGAQGDQGDPGPQGPPGPATGPAGGDLTGSYPEPRIADGVVGAAQIDPSAVQRRIAGGCTSFPATAISTIGEDGQVTCANTPVLGAGSTVPARVYSRFVNLDAATPQQFVMGQMRLETTAVAGQFRICTTAGSARPWVVYLNGVRSSGTSACSSTFTVPDAQSDFEGSMRRTRFWAAQSGDVGNPRSFYIVGISQL